MEIFATPTIELEGYTGAILHSSQTLAWEENGTIISNAANSQDSTDICPDGSGGAVIVRTDNREGGDINIYAQRISAAGVRQWSPSNGIIICNASGDQINPQISRTSTGEYIITWRDQRTDLGDIYAQKVSATDIRQWTPSNGVVLCDASGEQTLQKICCDNTGGAFIVWQDWRGTYKAIYALRIGFQGTIHGDTDGTRIDEDQTSNLFNSYICSDGNGNAFIAYSDEDQINPNKAVLVAQKLNSSGKVEWGVRKDLSSGVVENQIEPKMCSDSTGGAIIIWRDNRNDIRYDNYAQKINSTGDR